jgi:hypothetical protein
MSVGAVTYAAAVAKGLRKSACIVTYAERKEDVATLQGHDVHVVSSEATLTFQHTYTWFGNQRRLRVLKAPKEALSASSVPFRCRLARTILVGPLIQNDVDVPSFTKPRFWFWRIMLYFQHVGVMAQGHQRDLDAQGKVRHLDSPSDVLKDSITPQVHLFLSDVETDPWQQSVFDGIVRNVKSLVVTRGEKGVSVYEGSKDPLHIPAVSIAPIDTNGAGDTFATTFMIGVMQGHSVEDAGLRATWAASRVCLRPQSCKPLCCTEAVREEDTRHAQPEPLLGAKPPEFRLEPRTFE